MIWKFVLPAIAAVLLVFAVTHAIQTQRPEPDTPPPVPPPLTPFQDTVAGAGMVEPSTEASGTGNIAVGSQVSGIVTEIHVRIGDTVHAGDVLFEIDKRQALADLKAREAALEAAQSQLRKLQLEPRPEEVPVSEANVGAAEATYRLEQDQYERGKRLRERTGVITEEEFISREKAFDKAQAELTLARASLALLKAGAWQADINIAAAAVEQAKAQIEQAKVALELLLIRAPVDGTILQINVRPGEFVSVLAGQSLVLMGCTSPLHVRVNIDEEDLPRLPLNAPARAKIRGDIQQQELPLTFVRIEPYVVPKVSLTGVNTERVDTRVVQVIYAVDLNSPLVKQHKVLVGQLVDVFIDTRPTEASGPEASGSNH